MRTVGRPPRAAVVFAFAGLLLFFGLPLAGLVARAPWRSLGEHLGTPAVRSALWLSLVCGASATALSAVFGVPIAWVLARLDFPGRRVVRTLAFLPLVLPPVVGGVALLLAFGRTGPIGRLLGLQLPFTAAGAILAATFVAMPFFVLMVEAALRSLDPGFEESAAALGAGPWRTAVLALRMIAPALGAGAALTWARALGEFGATITFAGNVPGRTQTLPLAVYLALESDPGAAVALSLLLLTISTVVLGLVGARVLGLVGADEPR